MQKAVSQKITKILTESFSNSDQTLNPTMHRVISGTIPVQVIQIKAKKTQTQNSGKQQVSLSSARQLSCQILKTGSHLPDRNPPQRNFWKTGVYPVNPHNDSRL